MPTKETILACTRSENTALRYSAYLDAFYYLYSNASELLGTEYEPMLREAVSEVPDVVWEKDLYSYRADYWETNSDKEIIPTEPKMPKPGVKISMTIPTIPTVSKMAAT